MPELPTHVSPDLKPIDIYDSLFILPFILKVNFNTEEKKRVEEENKKIVFLIKRLKEQKRK